jgi:hypothetical protein
MSDEETLEKLLALNLEGAKTGKRPRLGRLCSLTA